MNIQEFDMEFIKRMLVLNYEILERMILPECSKKAGKPITQMTVILDVKGVSVTDLMSKNVYNLVTYSSKLIQDYYPEIVYKTLIINTPMMFSAFFKVIKPVLNSRTQASMSLSGSGYKKEIEKIISMENLPAEYGGTNKDHFDGKDYGFYSQVPNLPFSLKKWEVTEEDLKGPVINFPVLQTPVDIPMDNEENGQNEEQIEEDPNFDPNTLLDQNGEMQETIEENGEGDLQAEIAVDAGLTTPVMPLPPS